MRHVELFAGVGGFRLGIERAFNNQPEQGKVQRRPDENSADVEYQQMAKQPFCVFASEWDKHAAQTYNKNFGGQIDTRDIATIPNADIPAHDLLTGGFPCQTFSVAGKRAGFNETRGTMFFEVARILADKKPQHLVLENVKGLLNHDGGRTFQTILRVLADLGYRVEWQVFNSQHFGVPQNRERIYIVGHFGTCCGRQIFPIFGKEPAVDRIGQHESSGAQKFIKTRHLSQNGGLISNSTTLQASEIPHIIGTINHGAFKETSGRALTIDKSYHKGPDNHGQRPMVRSGATIRRLTPTECERLQGFPDGWTEGMSDGQRYKQMGNAVTVNVVETVIKKLYLLE